MAKSILGIDLRVASVKVVELEEEKEGFSLKNWGMTEVPYELLDKHPQIDDAKAEALKKIIQTNKIKTREAVVVVGGNQVLVKVFTLAELPRSEILQALKWKFAEEIPFPIEDAIIDYYPLPKGEVLSERVDYFAACIHRNLFLESNYILNKAGLKLIGITVLPEALREVFKKDLYGEEGKITSLIYMGKRTTNISIFHQGNFEFNREIPMGGENITLAMSGILVSAEGKVEVSPEEAEKLKIEYGVPVDLETFPKISEIPVGQLQAMVRPALEKIQAEILRTFEYYKGQTGEAAIEKVILTGGASQTKHLSEFLSQGLGSKVIVGETTPKLDVRLSAALGAALVNIQKFNLLPEEIKMRWQILIKKLLKPTVFLTILVAFLSIVSAYALARYFYLQSELNYITKKIEAAKPRLARLEMIEKLSQEEEKKKIIVKAYQEKRIKLSKIFEEIGRLIPESAHINILSTTTSEVHLWGTVFEKGENAETILSRFVLALSSSPLLENVQLVQATKNNEYVTEAFNFEIMAKMKE